MIQAKSLEPASPMFVLHRPRAALVRLGAERSCAFPQAASLMLSLVRSKQYSWKLKAAQTWLRSSKNCPDCPDASRSSSSRLDLLLFDNHQSRVDPLVVDRDSRSCLRHLTRLSADRLDSARIATLRLSNPPGTRAWPAAASKGLFAILRPRRKQVRGQAGGLHNKACKSVAHASKGLTRLQGLQRSQGVPATNTYATYTYGWIKRHYQRTRRCTFSVFSSLESCVSSHARHPIHRRPVL